MPEKWLRVRATSSLARLVDRIDDIKRAADPTVAWCAERGHPYVTYNPQMDESWCRCGQVRTPGQQEIDVRAIHETHHTCPYDGGTCRCYVTKEN